MDIGRTYLNMIKLIYNKLKASIILNGENLKEFLLRSGTGQWCPFSPFLFSIVLEDLVMAIREETEIKIIQTDKSEHKLSLFVDDMILYMCVY